MYILTHCYKIKTFSKQFSIVQHLRFNILKPLTMLEIGKKFSSDLLEEYLLYCAKNFGHI